MQFLKNVGIVVLVMAIIGGLIVGLFYLNRVTAQFNEETRRVVAQESYSNHVGKAREIGRLCRSYFDPKATEGQRNAVAGMMRNELRDYDRRQLPDDLSACVETIAPRGF